MGRVQPRHSKTMNQLSENSWNMIRQRLEGVGNEWVQLILRMPFSEIEKLPQLSLD
jgi:hypothetical protein